MPNTREAIAGDRRLMLRSPEGPWEPALPTYPGASAPTEDGTVWFTDNGQRSVWHPLEKTTLTAITDASVELRDDNRSVTLQLRQQLRRTADSAWIVTLRSASIVLAEETLASIGPRVSVPTTTGAAGVSSS